MMEIALGIAGLALLLLLLVMLALRPRRSRPVIEAGLALGAGLLGAATGLVVADRRQQPPTGLVPVLDRPRRRLRRPRRR